MNDKIKQLWWDIQHYGEILSRDDKSDYDNFYTDRTHKYQLEGCIPPRLQKIKSFIGS